MRKSSRSIKITEIEHLFCNSHRADVLNRVQNRDFSENRRWEPYKNHCHEKSIRARQFVAGAEKT